MLHSLIKPLGALVVAELREKLDPAAALSFDSLRAGDVITRQRPRFRLVVTKAGLSVERRRSHRGARCGGCRHVNLFVSEIVTQPASLAYHG